MTARFGLGQVVATPGALEAVQASGDNLLALLHRHQCGDWGDVDRHDWRVNDEGLIVGARLLSAYVLRDGTRVWIITEAVGEDGKRESTCLCLPSEY